MAGNGSTQTTADDILHESRITFKQWVILALCFCASMAEGFDIVIIAFTAPAITADWGISWDELGIVLSAGLFGMTLGAMLLSWVADVYGRRIVVSSTLVIAGVATCLVEFAETANQLAILRVVAGVALGVLVATLPPLVGEFSPGRHRTLIISSMLAGNSVGGVVGGFLVAATIADYGWQAIFVAAGAVTLVLGVLVMLLVPESIAFTIKRRPQSALDDVNRTLAYLGQAAIAELPLLNSDGPKESATVVSLLTPARRATTLLCWGAFFSGFLVVYFLSSWMPQVLTNGGLSQEKAIQATAVIPLGSIFGTVLIGWLARWVSLTRIIAVAFLISTGIMLLISAMMENIATLPFAMIWVLLFAIGIFLMGAFSNLYGVALTVYPVQVRSTGIGWSAGLGRAGAVISPLIAGWLIGIDVSLHALFIYFAAPALVAGLCVAFVRMRQLP
ncbi:MFS transporter [Pseudomaricurvus sp. HS19]|uniref:MFS transporter n=1 Tax=Pseudomaricurvus sp. HS19 TaxID=2692626 RepID=UPI00136B3186|nr:MFS transporter [Pseudomaricurvus sp. HS19]MYM64150.1 MFS transporter [Pseudomaricurvus sp. HS19]